MHSLGDGGPMRLRMMKERLDVDEVEMEGNKRRI